MKTILYCGAKYTIEYTMSNDIYTKILKIIKENGINIREIVNCLPLTFRNKICQRFITVDSLRGKKLQMVFIDERV